ncbi:PssE/Cps14G family polysaccharide biosynthesis glycosyltransferase [Streptococcus gallolyticus]|uniref:PssE/Cps14G family polysaccharide biosynthesis glycosyltransferase n=1 Tax=Streptococcus gallolyticus TaxID=315405 RepID=UPI001F188DE0|nr:PssE/Cps14G family polysaccharide biosynthesis glycosyltransferase [Streptococcus gallolyticus]MCF1633484.1 beta(1,3)galactosyltransferase EpsH [Streptococcus gallolyticus]MCF2567200.1 beta(1,3)galactosyltransferase EpsH [Streptococcus pasteurianus]MCY7187484.1 beta(1,3)galactosyltransferase EpsH [Streptococcus gallolyticus subsp. gallolyticus]
MIFVTLGSQKFQFNRLLIELDRLVNLGIIKDEIFAQIGYSDYTPMHYKFSKFLDRDQFLTYVKSADLVITHGGTGAIVGALKHGKKVIAVPRLSEYGEHVDNHQLQIIEQFQQQNFIYPCNKIEDIQEAIVKVGEVEFDVYHSNTDKIIKSIGKYIGK